MRGSTDKVLNKEEFRGYGRGRSESRRSESIVTPTFTEIKQDRSRSNRRGKTKVERTVTRTDWTSLKSGLWSTFLLTECIENLVKGVNMFRIRNII